MLSLSSERIDLRGASGAIYSFHLADPEQLPARAGAFAIVLRDGSIALVSATDSLSSAAQALAGVAARAPGARLYLRLNVRRQIRLAELGDLAASPDLAHAAAAA